MKKIRNLLTPVIFSLIMLPLINGCSTKQTAIRQMQNLAYDIRDNGSYYTVKDWEDAALKFANIRKKMANYNYTPSERRQIGELEGQCARYMVQGIKSGAINSIIGVGSEIRGILESLGIGF